MLSTRGPGKYLSEKWQSARDAAVIDSTHLSDADKDHLEITGTTGANPPERYKIDSTPMDPNTEPSLDAVDVRKLPKSGGIV
ncbi:hypothetical protein [Methanococcoides sp. FTZ1]|uniref:hypothetical protein n=1 Tax=Methanococcoides sp. FTZ1 TaxID=3439061 RepID=UPI003F84A375